SARWAVRPEWSGGSGVAHRSTGGQPLQFNAAHAPFRDCGLCSTDFPTSPRAPRTIGVEMIIIRHRVPHECPRPGQWYRAPKGRTGWVAGYTSAVIRFGCRAICPICGNPRSAWSSALPPGAPAPAVRIWTHAGPNPKTPRTHDDRIEPPPHPGPADPRDHTGLQHGHAGRCPDQRDTPGEGQATTTHERDQ